MLLPFEVDAPEVLAPGVREAKAEGRSMPRYENADEEIRDLRRALRESRQRLRRSAGESTRRIASLTNEVQRLADLCSTLREQVARYEASTAIVELGCRLMRLSQENDALNDAAKRVWTLERTIEAAHAEYLRLSLERDALAAELYLDKADLAAIAAR